jgi:CBS domain-containing protein
MQSVLQTTLGQLLFEKRELIKVDKEISVQDAAAVMDKHKIISLPVR